jgi:Domain of unknown function (DUF4402)
LYSQGDKTLKKIAIFAVAAAISTPAFAAPGDTANANGAATAEVVAPITLTHTPSAALDFGTFTTGTGGGTIVVTQAGVATDSGDVTLVSGSTSAADAFSVAGDAGRAFTITTASGTVANGGTTMAFTTSAPASGTLTGGTAAFNVGGTLTVVGGEAAGTYTGSYSVTVAYN